MFTKFQKQDQVFQPFGTWPNRQVVEIKTESHHHHHQKPWWEQIQVDKYVYNFVLEPKDDVYNQRGWYLTAERNKPFDKRDDCSTRIVLRRPTTNMAAWRIIPKEGGKYFNIVLAEDERRLSGINMTGWYLALHKWFDDDKRDDFSAYAMVHSDSHVANAKWSITPTNEGKTFRVSLYECDNGVTKNQNLTGASLTCHRVFDKDKKNKRRTYVSAHVEQKDSQEFKLVRDLNPLNQKKIQVNSSDSGEEIGKFSKQQREGWHPEGQQYGQWSNRQVIIVKEQVKDPWWKQLGLADHNVNIVLVNPKDQAQDGWYLGAERTTNYDKRDEVSTRLVLKRATKNMCSWRLTPHNNGEYFTFKLMQDERRMDDTNMSGWTMAVQNFFSSDKRDDGSYRPFIHSNEKVPNNKFKITPQGQNLFKISLYENDSGSTKGVDLKGFTLTSHRFYDSDKKNDRRTFVNFHKDNNLDNQSFALVRDLNDPNIVHPSFQDSSDSDVDAEEYHGGHHHHHHHQSQEEQKSNEFIIQYQPPTFFKSKKFKQYGNWANREQIFINPQVKKPFWEQLELHKYSHNLVLESKFDKYGQDDWYLTAEREKPFEKRDDESTRLTLRKPKHSYMTGWRLIPQNGGEYFYILLAEDERKLDGKNMKGWLLALHNAFDQDKRDDYSYWPCIHCSHQTKNTKWSITHTDDGTGFYIRLFECDGSVTKGTDVKNYYLAAHRWFKDKDIKGNHETYVHCRVGGENDGMTWKFIRDYNQPY